MRLPWPFGRGTTSGASASEPAGPPTNAEAPAPAVPRLAPPTRAWASLAPIQRTVGAAPLVAPTEPFLHDVPGNRPLPAIVQPLGHEAAPTAPAGLVVAHATPVPSLTSNASMPTRPVQRRATAAAAEPAWTSAGDGAATQPGSVAAPAATAAPEPEPQPVRRVAPVAPSQTVTPPARPLTVAPPITASRPPVAQRSAAAGTPAPTPAAAAPAAPAEPALPLAARGTPPTRSGARWSEGAASRPGLGAPMPPAPVQATAAGPATPGPTPATPTPSAAPTPAAPRAGLGAPLTSVPDTAQRATATRLPLIQRLAAAHAAETGARQTTGPLPPPLLPAVAAQRAAPTPGHDPATGPAAHVGDAPGGPVGDHAVPAPGRALPVLPVVRPRSERAGPEVGTAQRSADGSSSAAGRATTMAPRTGAPAPAAPAPEARPAPTILPLVGSRPLRPAVALQREAAGDRDAPAAPAADLPVPARWAAGDDLPATVQAADRPAPAMDAVPLQRLAAPEPTPSPAAPPITGGPAPASGWHGAHSPALGSPGVAAAVASGRPAVAATGRASRPAPSGQAPTLQLARPAPPAPVPAPVVVNVPAPSGRIEAPTVTTTAPAPTVQTSPAATLSLPTFTSTPVVQRAEGAAPPPEGGQTGRTDRELDELAKQLFGRVRGQLRAEVITEREARGLSFDAF